MKKLFGILIALLLCFGLVGCGDSSSSEDSKMTIGKGGQVLLDYESQGYFVSSSTIIDNVYKVIYCNEDGTDCLLISIPMTDADMTKYDELDVMEEDYFEQLDAWIYSLDGEAVVESLNDKIPSQEEADKFVGMSVQEALNVDDNFTSWWDLEDTEDFTVHAGYNTEDGYGIIYRFQVEIPEGKTQADLTDDDVLNLIITSASFDSFQ